MKGSTMNTAYVVLTDTRRFAVGPSLLTAFFSAFDGHSPEEQMPGRMFFYEVMLPPPLNWTMVRVTPTGRLDLPNGAQVRQTEKPYVLDSELNGRLMAALTRLDALFGRVQGELAAQERVVRVANGR